MKNMILAISLCFLAAGARAATVVQRCADVPAILAEIDPDIKGYQFSSDGELCYLSYIEKAGRTPVFIDRKARREALLAELGLLEDKLDAGTSLTAAEMRRALKIIFKLSRFSKDAP